MLLYRGMHDTRDDQARAHRHNPGRAVVLVQAVDARCLRNAGRQRRRALHRARAPSLPGAGPLSGPRPEPYKMTVLRALWGQYCQALTQYNNGVSSCTKPLGCLCCHALKLMALKCKVAGALPDRSSHRGQARTFRSAATICSSWRSHMLSNRPSDAAIRTSPGSRSSSYTSASISGFMSETIPLTPNHIL